jgi:GT2 family glycosyltransferase
VDTTILLLSADEAPNLRHSLPLALAQHGARVAVIDNASSDATAELARSHAVEHIRLQTRVSYAEAMNAGLRATDGDAVLLLNADCFLTPDFLAAALPRLEELGVGSVAPKLIRAQGPPGASLDRIDAVGIYMHRSRKNVLAGHGRPLPAFDSPAEVFGPDGAAALYRRETLEDCAVGGSFLDEDFESLATDVDLAWRAARLGWRCVYEPRAVALHIRRYRPSARRLIPERERRLVFRNRYLMIMKNDAWRDLIRDLPWIAAYELLALAYALARERHLIRGYAEAARLLPAAMRRRATLHARRGERRLSRAHFNALPPDQVGHQPAAARASRPGQGMGDPR